MPKRTARKQHGPLGAYPEHTLRPLNSLLLVAPLLAFFHIGAWYWGIEFIPPRDLRRILSFFGATAWFLPPMLVVVVLLLQHAALKEPWKPQGMVILGMLGEGVLWTLPLIAVSFLRGGGGNLVASAGPLAGRSVLQQLVYVCGAGVYEEFLFRLLLIGLILLVFVDLFRLAQPYV
ncbi:MAG: hypothetical protein ACOC93_04985, partial [Planctomycetota bacterium]